MFGHLLPSAEVRWIEESLELHQAAQEFRQEVEARQAHADYCQWYVNMAAQTQAEIVAMENDVNFFSWFWGRRRSASASP